MEINLENKRGIVAGSTQGIGKAIAKSLAMCGAEVILVARDKNKLAQTQNELDNSFSQNHAFIVADFSKPDTLNDQLEKYFGEEKGCHIVVNNTGGPPPGPIIEANEDDFLKAFQQHLICNQLMVQRQVEFMKREGYGRIINVISTSVKIPIEGLGVSNTTRGAVANWAKTLSFELARFGITVNNILPGFVKTGRLDAIVEKKAQGTGKSFAEMEQMMKDGVPAKRFGKPEELGHLAAFLASSQASYINGTSIPVDGGRTGSL